MPESLTGVVPVAGLVAGAVLLTFGRRLFWLFVGVIGFIVAYRLAEGYLGAEGTGWLVAAVVGVLGALAAVLVQKVAVTLAGFAAAAVGTLWLAEQLGFAPGIAVIVVAVVAGLVGALVVRALFELGLVVLSSLVGAALIVEGVGRAAPGGLLFVLLAVVGIAFQLGFGRRRRRAG